MVKLNTMNLPLNGREVTSKWGWFMAMGIFLLVVGFIASMTLTFATVAVAIFLGIMMVVAGVIQLINAFSVQSWGRFTLWLLAGIIYTIGGVVCFTQPLLAAAIFTFFLGFMLIVSGVVRMIIGFQSTNLTGWGWIVTAGAISTLLGIMITTSWPTDTLWILGLFLSIDLIFQGCGWIAFSLGLRNLRNS